MRLIGAVKGHCLPEFHVCPRSKPRPGRNDSYGSDLSRNRPETKIAAGPLGAAVLRREFWDLGKGSRSKVAGVVLRYSLVPSLRLGMRLRQGSAFPSDHGIQDRGGAARHIGYKAEVWDQGNKTMRRDCVSGGDGLSWRYNRIGERSCRKPRWNGE